MDLFASYEQEFETSAKDLQKLLLAVTTGSGSSRQVAIAQDEYNVAKGCLEKMKIEARGKKNLRVRVKNNEGRLSSLKKDLKQAKLKLSREQLTGGDIESGRSDNGGVYHDRLSATETRMQGMNERMAEMRRTLADTEDTAVGALDELYAQREVLIGAGKKNQDTQGVMSEARHVLTRMGRRETCNKIASKLLFVLMFIVLLIFFYYMLFK